MFNKNCLCYYNFLYDLCLHKKLLELKKNSIESFFYKNLRSATIKLCLSRLKLGTSVYRKYLSHRKKTFKSHFFVL